MLHLLNDSLLYQWYCVHKPVNLIKHIALLVLSGGVFIVLLALSGCSGEDRSPSQEPVSASTSYLDNLDIEGESNGQTNMPLSEPTSSQVNISGVDPSTINGVYAPPEGQILLFAGQTESGLIAYDETFNDHPFGATFYTSPVNLIGIVRGDADNVGTNDMNGILQRYPNSALAVGWFMGFDIDHDIVHNTQLEDVPPEPIDFDKSYPEDADPQPCLTGRFVNHQLGEPACGANMRENMRASIRVFKNTGRPVFLRIGYEAEGPWNAHNPDIYKRLWQLIKEEIDAQEAHNIVTVWQLAVGCFPYGQDFIYNDAPAQGRINNTGSRGVNGNSADPQVAFEPWYPGDDLVDWVGFSFFTENSDCRNGLDTVRVALDYLKTKEKPVFLAEAAPRGLNFGDSTYTRDPGGIGLFFTDENTANSLDYDSLTFEPNNYPIRSNDMATRRQATGNTLWDKWFPDLLTLLDEYPEIQALAYINDDWEQFASWRCDPSQPRTSEFVPPEERNCGVGYWGDTQLGNNPVIRERWQAEIIDAVIPVSGNESDGFKRRFLQASSSGFSYLSGWCETFPEHAHCRFLAPPEGDE